MITETDDVAAALADAAQAWPDARNNKNALLKLLLQAGHQSLRHEDQTSRVERLAALDAAAGALTGLYEADYLQQLRQDWPA
jgi:phage-related minor tail protein